MLSFQVSTTKLLHCTTHAFAVDGILAHALTNGVQQLVRCPLSFPRKKCRSYVVAMLKMKLNTHFWQHNVIQWEGKCIPEIVCLSTWQGLEYSRYTGVPQYTVVHWSTPVYCGTLVYSSILWYTGVPQYTVVEWSTLVYCGTLEHVK